jgi:hypothetical protein
MTEPASHVKDPRLVAAGKAGMLARWGPARVVRLDELRPEYRRLILAMVEAAKAAAVAEPDKV